MTVKNSSDDYRAVRYDGAGIIDLSSRRGRILVSGRDAAMFLNGLVTNDVKNLARGSWIPAAFANVQGRLIAAVRIIHRDDGFLIDTEAVTLVKVVELLSRFTLAGDFHVTDLTSEIGTVSLQGKKSAEIVGSQFGEDAVRLVRGRVLQSTFSGQNVTLIRATHTAEEGFDLFIDSGALGQLEGALWNAGAEEIDDETFEVLRIEAGIPRFGIDMDENTIVSETCLDDAISETKGCYVGQEILIRIKHRGHVAKKQTGIILKEAIDLEPDAAVLSEEGNEIGRVTSATISPNLNQTVAMAYLKFDYLKIRTPIKVEIHGQMHEGVVDEIPLLRSSWYGVVEGQVPA